MFYANCESEVMKVKNQPIKNIISILFFLGTILAIFLTHRAVPFMMDDLWYSTILSDESVKLSGLGDIIKAQIWHYNNWGGRSMTHTILQLILIRGELFADILNTIVTVLISLVILLFAEDISGRKIEGFCDKLISITFIMGALHGLNANWKMSMYWQSGSANYLYITVFILLFMWLYVRELSENAPKMISGVTFFIIPLGILAGWSNENMGPTAFLVSIFAICFLRKKKRKVQIWMILGSIFSFLGSLVCIIAPGNFVRSAEAAEEKGIIWRIYLRLYSECRGAFDYLFPSLLVVLILIAVYCAVKANTPDVKSIVVFSAGIIACGAMIASPHFPDRATFGSMALFIVLSVSIVLRLMKKEVKKIYFILPGVMIWLHGMFYLMEFLGISNGWIL